MQEIDVTAPEVQSLHQHARFFKDGGRNMVEISFVGSKDTIIHGVRPEHMSRFKNEWDAYCDGKAPERRKGTPFSEINMPADVAENYVHRNLHNLEELAALSDAQCQALGHGTLTQRNTAQKYLAQKKFEQDERARKLVSDLSAEIGPRPAEEYAAQSDLKAVSDKVENLTAAVESLVRILGEKKKPGRPKKVINEPSEHH